MPVVETWQSAVTSAPLLYVVDDDHAGAPQLPLGVPQTLAVPPPPHVCGDVHAPHDETVRVAPQLSVPVTVPQFLPRREQKPVSDSGVQEPPHTLGVPPPPHVMGDVQVPQEVTVRETPQLSAAVTEPQFFPRRKQKSAFVSDAHPAGPNIWISAS